jgi:hypothetical protein
MPLEQFASQFGLSELQLALGLIGLLFLVWVIVYNIRNARRRNSDQVEQKEGPIGFAELNNDSVLEPFEESSPNQTISPQAIDPRIDCVVALRFSEPIAGIEILHSLKTWSDLQTPWMADGLISTNIGEGVWGALESNHFYTEIQLAVQLASRRGPIGVVELSDFCSRVQVLAEALDAQIDMPSVSAMLDSAKELDALAAQSDILLGINIVFDQQSWSWPHLESTLTQRGFRLASNGASFEYPIQGKLAFGTGQFDRQAPIKQITLLLEVPVVMAQLRPFDLMLNEAADIAEALQGRLVDDNGVNLTEGSVNMIRDQLDALYAQLEKVGISAGSSTAIRLFS